MNRESQRKRKNRRKPPLVLIFMRLVFSTVGVVMPAIVGRWSYRLWFMTRRNPAPKREQKWLASARTERIRINDHEVMTYHWADDKNGPDVPLVMMLHGWGGRGSQMGAFAAPLLQAGFRVMAFDNHAHGQTDGKASTIFIQSEIQRALVDKLGPVHALVCHSFGGMVSAYSLNQGMQANKVVCISSPSRFEYLLERFSLVLNLPSGIQRYMMKRFDQDFGEGLSERVSATSTSRQLGAIPALLIHDEEDYDVPISEAEYLQASWPNAELLRTRGLGHRRILYNDEVIEKTVKFVAGEAA